MAGTFFHWDSVQYALGAMDFNLAAHQPHPPGYWVFVKVIRIFLPLAGDPNLLIILVNILFTMMAAFFLLEAGRVSGREDAGRLAAALFLVSPVTWMYGEIATGHLAAPALASLLLFFCFRGKGSGKDLILVSVLVGIWAGIRQVETFLLGPLYLLAIVRGTKNRRLRVICLFSALAAFSAWFLPFLEEAGGLREYIRISREHYTAVCHDKSLLYGATLSQHLRVLIRAMLWLAANLGIAGALILALSLAGILRYGKGIFSFWRDKKGVLVAGILPAFLFFTFVHIGLPSYWFLILPPVFFLIVTCYLETGKKMGRLRIYHLVAWIGISLGAVYFIVPSFIVRSLWEREKAKPVGEQSLQGIKGISRFMKYSSGEIFLRDRILREVTSGVLERIKDGEGQFFGMVQHGAVIDWRRLSWYLPDLPLFYMFNQYGGEETRLGLFLSREREVDYESVQIETASLEQPVWFEVRLPRRVRYLLLFPDETDPGFRAFRVRHSPEKIPMVFNAGIYRLEISGPIIYSHIRFVPSNAPDFGIVPVLKEENKKSI